MVRLKPRDPILARHIYLGFSWKLHEDLPIFPIRLNLFTVNASGSVERSLGVPGAPLGLWPRGAVLQSSGPDL